MNIAQRFTAIRQHFANAAPGRLKLYGAIAAMVLVAGYLILSSGTEAVSEVGEVTGVTGTNTTDMAIPWPYLIAVILVVLAVVGAATGKARGISNFILSTAVILLVGYMLIDYFGLKDGVQKDEITSTTAPTEAVARYAISLKAGKPFRLARSTYQCYVDDFTKNGIAPGERYPEGNDVVYVSPVDKDIVVWLYNRDGLTCEGNAARLYASGQLK